MEVTCQDIFACYCIFGHPIICQTLSKMSQVMRTKITICKNVNPSLFLFTFHQLHRHNRDKRHCQLNLFMLYHHYRLGMHGTLHYCSYSKIFVDLLQHPNVVWMTCKINFSYISILVFQQISYITCRHQLNRSSRYNRR
jgi:hypothetical protein